MKERTTEQPKAPDTIRLEPYPQQAKSEPAQLPLMREQKNLTDPASHEDDLDRTLDFVRAQLVDGLRHGFFEIIISCELIKGRKRRLVVKAGRSEQFVIAADEAERKR